MDEFSDDELSKPHPLDRTTELVIAWCFGVVGVALVALGSLLLTQDGLVAQRLLVPVTGCISFGAFFILMACQLFLRTPSSPPEILTLRGWSWFTGFLLALAFVGGVVDWLAAVCPLVIAGFCLLRQPSAMRHFGRIAASLLPPRHH